MACLIQRGSGWYIQFCVSGKRGASGERADRERKLRHTESANFLGEDNPLPTRTPIENVVGDYPEY